MLFHADLWPVERYHRAKRSNVRRTHHIWSGDDSLWDSTKYGNVDCGESVSWDGWRWIDECGEYYRDRSRWVLGSFLLSLNKKGGKAKIQQDIQSSALTPSTPAFRITLLSSSQTSRLLPRSRELLFRPRCRSRWTTWWLALRHLGLAISISNPNPNPRHILFFNLVQSPHPAQTHSRERMD